MPQIIVFKDDISPRPEIQDAVSMFCSSIIETAGSIKFIPNAGSLMTIVVMLSEKGVPYRLTFD